MKLLDELHHPEKYFRILLKWGTLGLAMGLIGGLLGAVFHHALHFVTHLRQGNNWLLFLLPVGGLLTVGLYQFLFRGRNRGTNEIIDAVLNGKPVNPLVAPAIFVATCITHLFGGSAGREGAALQIGGSVASVFGKILRLKDNERTVLVMSGLASVFAGLFGTPLTATLFTMEFASVGTIFSPALLPCYLAAFTAARISGLLGVHAETAILHQTLDISLWNSAKLVVFAAMIGLIGVAMCFVFHKVEHLAEKKLKNRYLRIAVGGILIVVLTLLVGDHRYNGAGMDMALLAVEGQANWYDFLMKMLFTAVTLAAGFKGGEIVPTFCIGATFGCLIGGLLGLDAGICGALGLVGLFCCATNSPIASLILSIEMFGSSNLYAFALVCVIAYVISGNWGLYSSQVIRFSKARLVRKNEKREK